MNDLRKITLKYFWIAIVGASSAGIWLPLFIALFNDITKYPFKELPPNITTYFLGILIAGCIDKGLKLFEDDANRSKNEFLNIIIVLCVTFMLVLSSVLGSISDKPIVAFITSVFGVCFALRIWWNVHIKSIDNNATSILGGTV